MRLSLFGTEGCFEEQPEGDVWVNREREITPLNDLLRCVPVAEERQEGGRRSPTDSTQHDFYSGMAPVHPVWRLPAELVSRPSGHHGSHHFLADDFVRACTTGALPPNHVWAAARYNLPGIIAHESAKREGELMAVPDLGRPAGRLTRCSRTCWRGWRPPRPLESSRRPLGPAQPWW